MFAQPPYAETLLTSARAHINEGQFGFAVILCQMAAEYYTEITFDVLFNKKNVPELIDPIEGLLNNYNIRNERVSALFNVLSGDTIQQQPFWSDLTKHSKLRNAIIHKRYLPSKDEAEVSATCVECLVAYLKTFTS